MSRPVMIYEEHLKDDMELEKLVINNHYESIVGYSPCFCGRAYFYNLDYNCHVDVTNDISLSEQFVDFKSEIVNSSEKWHAFSCSLMKKKNLKPIIETYYLNNHLKHAYKYETELYTDPMGYMEIKYRCVNISEISLQFMSGYYNTLRLIMDALNINYF